MVRIFSYDLQSIFRALAVDGKAAQRLILNLQIGTEVQSSSRKAP